MTNNYVSSNGLVIQPLSEIITELEDGFKAIYGPDINIDANSPDGQMIALFAQAKIDMLELVASVYNSFSPTNASGVVLDQRCAINGVVRAAGIRTQVVLAVWANSVTNLIGESSDSGTPFTVKDPANNSFYLKDDATTAIGINYFTFIAEETGDITVAPATITTIETITLGITGVTGPTGSVTVQGRAEETDAQLRYRRDLSTAKPSMGYMSGLIGGLLEISDVIDAKVYENTSSVTDGDGIPGHSIWPIVDGGDQTDIAETIYQYRNAGCGLYGGTGATGATGTQKIVGVTQPNGQLFNVYFATPTYQNLYVVLTITTYDSFHDIDSDFLKEYLVDNISYRIYDPADLTAIYSEIKTADPLAVITTGGLGYTGGTGATGAYLYPSAKCNRWILSSSNININTV